MKLVKTISDHRKAMARLEQLMLLDPAPGSAESNELEVLAFLIESFEKSRFPMPLPSPLAAIRFRMEQQQLSPKDLEPFLGTKSKVSEVLAGKRPLSMTMIRKLHEGLGIPADVLLQAAAKPDRKKAGKA